MRTQSTAWRPAHTSPARARGSAGTWVEDMPALARALGLSGLLLAFGLLIGFYIVVAGAVHRADAGRRQARLDVDRHAACSAFTQAEAGDLCAVTIVSRVPPNNLAKAVYQPSAWASARHPVASHLY